MLTTRLVEVALRRYVTLILAVQRSPDASLEIFFGYKLRIDDAELLAAVAADPFRAFLWIIDQFGIAIRVGARRDGSSFMSL